jgi:hypothetical protein
MILFDKNRLIEFIPTKDMTISEQLNAITRFSLWFSIILLLYYKNPRILYIFIITAIIIYIIALNIIKPIKINTDLSTKIDINNNNEVCQMPTNNNPFMNILLTDYVDAPNRNVACKHEDEDVKKDVDKYFSHNLYKNLDDIWNNKNSQREFYTMPSSTIPNDRKSFMNWCWKTPYTCKENNENCNEIHDLRVQKNINY